MQTCKIEGCDRRLNSRKLQLCLKHYKRWRRGGDPTRDNRRREDGADLSQYSRWRAMIARCYNPRHISYRYYGGRGIKVCKPWRENYANFVRDMGPPPTPKHTLDRIDNDGDYSPENCRWADVAEQRRNSRGSVKLSYRGETLMVREWATELGIDYWSLLKRLQAGWTVERALTQPMRRCIKKV